MLDPKQKAGSIKDPLSLNPTCALRAMCRVLALGAAKYGLFNWRTSEGIGATTYTSAINRHLLQYLDGEDIDEESGESHLAHIMAGCAILLDAERAGNLNDNRPKL